MRMYHASQQTVLAAGETALHSPDNPVQLSSNESLQCIYVLAGGGPRVGENRWHYCTSRNENNLSTLIKKNSL